MAGGLDFVKAIFPHVPVEEIHNGNAEEGLLDHEQFALIAEGKLLFRDDGHSYGSGQLFVVGAVLLILGLGDEHMGQIVVAQQLQKALEVVCLIAFQAETLGQVDDQLVIIVADLVAGESLRPEIACHAELLRVREHHGRGIVRHTLGDGDARL